GEHKIAEATATHPDLIGKKLRETTIRQRANVSIVGTWERGVYRPAHPDVEITAGSMLILAGDTDQLNAWNDTYATPGDDAAQVVVIGGGRVGRAAAQRLRAGVHTHTVIEKRDDRIPNKTPWIHGDAADLDVLQQAGVLDASAVLITTHDDDVNLYLSIFCRQLRPDLQIISRAILDRNVATLHRAGADAVLSAASLGAAKAWHTLGLTA